MQFLNIVNVTTSLFEHRMYVFGDQSMLYEA